MRSAIRSRDLAQSPQHRRFVRRRSSGRCCWSAIWSAWRKPT